MKHSGSIALVFVLIAALLPISASAAGARLAQPMVYLEPALSAIQISDEAVVQVWCKDVTDFYGVSFALTFDPTIVEGIDAVPGAAFTAYPDEYEVLHDGQIVSGTVQFTATLLRVPKAPPLNGTLHLATLTFKGLRAGTSPLTWTWVQLADSQSRPIPATFTGGQIQVGGGTGPTLGNLLKGVAIDPARNRIYVAVQSSRTIAVLDLTTHDLLDQVPCRGLFPNGLALSHGGSRLWVVNSGSNQVAVLDVDGGFAPLAMVDVGRNPFGIAIAGDVAYATNFDDGTVTLIDVNAMAVRDTLWVGHHPSMPAAAGNRAYVPIHSAFSRFEAKDASAEWDYVQRNKGTDTGVAIVYGDGRAVPVERVLDGHIGFFAAAVDTTQGRVYVTKRDGTAEGLYVLDLSDHHLIQFVPMLRPYAVAVNPATQHVIAVQADMDEVYILDGANGYRLIRALNTASNNGDMPGMHGGQGIALSGSQVVVSHFAAGTLTFFQDMPGEGFAVPIDVEYIRGWQEGGGNHGPLGQPLAPSYAYWYSEQQYERGSLHWRQVPSGPNQVYVFDNESTKPGGTDWMGRDDGIWTQQDDGWHVGLPLFPAGCPEAGWPYGPMFGFGLAWCTGDTTRGKIKAVIGYPIGWEYGTVGGDQAFAGGVVFWNPASDAYYVLRSDNHTWRYFRAHRRYDTGEIAPNIVGQVHLQGRASGQGVSLTSPSGPHTSTREDGSFGLHFLGQADLTFRHLGYLDVVMTVKGSESAILDAGEIAMVGGDVNGDNRIDILDIAYVAARWNGTDPLADLNGSGQVDILDLSMVCGNMGLAGPAQQGP